MNLYYPLAANKGRGGWLDRRQPLSSEVKSVWYVNDCGGAI
jgi:hypothetical protein